MQSRSVSCTDGVGSTKVVDIDTGIIDELGAIDDELGIIDELGGSGRAATNSLLHRGPRHVQKKIPCSKLPGTGC